MLNNLCFHFYGQNSLSQSTYFARSAVIQQKPAGYTADLLMEYQSKSAGGILKVAGVQQILAVAEIF